MFLKINTADLRAGMYIVDSGVSWLKHPFLYSTAGELTWQELAALLEQGFTEAYIDLSRCRPGSLTPDLEAQLAAQLQSAPAESDSDAFMPPPPKVAMDEELPKARAVFQSSLTMAKDLMEDVRSGKAFDLPSAEPLVENILESLDRNADALFSLCKLRQKDDYTFTHCVNVSVLMVMFARGLGMGNDTLHGIGLGGLFHDVGKALIPLEILHAPRRLTDAELAVMRRHPELGHDYLNEYRSAPKEVFQVALEHHEQYCGKGYPKSLDSETISLPGRISAVVDVFDALSSKRPYKDAMPLSKALSILYSMREKEFFPGMAERFIRLLGVYPLGSAVELEDWSLGVVCEANSATPMKPKVTLVRDKSGKDLGLRVCDLTASGSPAIRRTITAAELGKDPATVLGVPV